jgi:hypothetical protein
MSVETIVEDVFQVKDTIQEGNVHTAAAAERRQRLARTGGKIATLLQELHGLVEAGGTDATELCTEMAAGYTAYSTATTDVMALAEASGNEKVHTALELATEASDRVGYEGGLAIAVLIASEYGALAEHVASMEATITSGMGYVTMIGQDTEAAVQAGTTARYRLNDYVRQLGWPPRDN